MIFNLEWILPEGLAFHPEPFVLFHQLRIQVLKSYELLFEWIQS